MRRRSTGRIASWIIAIASNVVTRKFPVAAPKFSTPSSGGKSSNVSASVGGASTVARASRLGGLGLRVGLLLGLDMAASGMRQPRAVARRSGLAG
ncbi:hypothetical protein ASF20_13490 [Methylobacterium sp. Leaf88]|nr:hypothetical protein ASF20_13490 [Methylobacterium sp. Leaf88]